MHNIKILELIKKYKKSNKNKIVKEEKEIVLEIWKKKNIRKKKFRIRHKTHHPV